jgi:hypothetical protein
LNLPVGPMAQAANAQPDLRCRLAVAAVATSGQPVPLQFTLHNAGAAPVRWLVWGTPVDGWFAPFVALQRDGVALAYQGAMVKRGEPAIDDYLLLAAGQSLQAEINLAEAFDLRTPGSYQLTPQIVLHDVAPGDAAVPRPRAQHQRLPLHCPPGSFEVRAAGR